MPLATLPLRKNGGGSEGWLAVIGNRAGAFQGAKAQETGAEKLYA